MEITNEIKAKVFAQYLGQRINVTGNKTNEPLTTIQLGIEYPKINKLHHINDCKLILKPLSAITDNEAAMVFDLEYPDNSVLRSTKIDRVKLWATDYNFTFISVQYLQSQGYDLPHYLLGNKTLFESGLAIYENEK